MVVVGALFGPGNAFTGRATGRCNAVDSLTVQRMEPLWSGCRLAANVITDKNVKACIDACVECAQTCEFCAQQCIDAGDADMAKCIKLCLDCAALRLLCVSLLARGSEESRRLCELYAEICERCAEECERFDDETMRACAQTCRAAAEACRQLSAA
jgi:hypothetical protein